MSGTVPALGVLVGILLELFGGFVLVAMLPIVSIGGNGDLIQHFGAMILYFVVGAVPLIGGLKMSGTSKAKAVFTFLIATLAGVVGVLALVHALRFMAFVPMYGSSGPAIRYFGLCISALQLSLGTKVWSRAACQAPTNSREHTSRELKQFHSSHI